MKQNVLNSVIIIDIIKKMTNHKRFVKIAKFIMNYKNNKFVQNAYLIKNTYGTIQYVILQVVLKNNYLYISKMNKILV